ncbi:hypothetical protein M2428_002150 [Arthrobacter sp. ES3-54]|nr:hypothetical protein [Arthrobacter sp. ES3-54]
MGQDLRMFNSPAGSNPSRAYTFRDSAEGESTIRTALMLCENWIEQVVADISRTA